MSKVLKNLHSNLGRPRVEIPDTTLDEIGKAYVQMMHRRAKAGTIVPCEACGQTGIERFTDAAGSRDWQNCSVCEGWGVVKI